MKLTHIALPILGAILCGTVFAEQSAPAGSDPHHSTGETISQNDTPAQQQIAAAQLLIAAKPKMVQAYDELAIGFVRRARETADPKYLHDAETALDQGFKLDADDFQLQKTQVALMLARHEFGKALDLAKAIHSRVPDDIMTYGYLAEADIALGDYSEAETNAQWMMNMRPNNTPALLLGARLRILFGDAHGAMDFLNRAYSQTSPSEVEDLAWIANQIALIQIDSGDTNAAEQTLRQADQLFPRYPCTIENLARLRVEQHRAADAVQLWNEAALVDHDPSLLYDLARALEAAGQPAKARAEYEQFARSAGEPGSVTYASEIDLILMYAASPATATKALKLAEQAVAARQDVWTLDAFAWALYANGKFQEADSAEQKAIAVGIQNAQIFDHAGHIAQKLSAHFAAGMSDRVQPASPVMPAIRLLQVEVPQSASSTIIPPSRNAVRSATKLSASFSEIPEVLLTPQTTGSTLAILTSQAVVARTPKDATAYARLGAAYFQRARETGDVADYQMAEESLSHSLDLDSTDFSAAAALGAMSEVCMGEHRFADALQYAQKALSLGTGDLTPFAIVGDAYADMGEYDKAQAAYSRLTAADMSPVPRAAYVRDSRLSYLKFISGDTTAAINLMKAAVTEGLEAQLPGENLAWLYYELGEYETQAGDVASADEAYLSALTTHPGDYRALAAMAKLRANNGRYVDAIRLYQKAIAVVPMPTFVAELGDLYAKTGDQADAQKQYALVEYIGLLGRINQVLHNRDLALFYADHDMKVGEALELAQKELDVRHDIYSWDALAWALYKNGKSAEAASASEKAMLFGTRDSLILFHAAMIAKSLGQQEKARKDLKEALEINPRFHLIYASTAKQELNSIDARAEAKETLDEHAR